MRMSDIPGWRGREANGTAKSTTARAAWQARNGLERHPRRRSRQRRHDRLRSVAQGDLQSANHLEEQLAYLDWLWKTRDSGFAWTKQFFQLPGLNIPMTADLNGVRVFVDAFSAQYLSGVVIDYVTSMQGSGFTFTNPNATGGCGCGSSFTV